MEFQAVIMAAGTGSRMSALTTKVPKALLPVANKPMIWYPIHMLETTGYKECIIVVQEKDKSEVLTALKDVYQFKINLQMVGIPDREWGTADSLRYLNEKDYIKSDVLVLSCDSVCTASLHQLADKYRQQGADLAILLGKAIDAADLPVPDQRNNRRQVKDLVGLSAVGNQVLILQTEADLGRNLTLTQHMIVNNPNMVLRTDLIDSHIYIMKKSLVDKITDSIRKKPSLKAEVIPYLVSLTRHDDQLHQHEEREKEREGTGDQSPEDKFIYAVQHQQGLDSCLLSDLAHWYSTSKRALPSDGQTVCIALVSEGSFIVRANTVLMYCVVNWLTPRFGDGAPLVHPAAVISDKTQFGGDVRVGEGTRLGERCGLKKTVIGKHCSISDRVKLNSCIIMDRVTIEEGVTMSGCVVCSNAHIGKKAELKDCIVGFTKTIVDMGKFTNEVIQVEEHLIDLQD